MSGTRLFPQPLHQIVAESPNRWRAEGSDPQFRLQGPFARGFWELRFEGAAPSRPPFDVARVYYAPDGQFTEAGSVSFPWLGDHVTPHALKFWLPMDAAWLRLDPTEGPGEIELGPIDAIHASPAFGVLRGAAERFVQSPRQTLAAIGEILAASLRNPRERNRLLVALALPDNSNAYEQWLARRADARRAEYPVSPDFDTSNLFSLITTVFDTPAEYIQVLGKSVFDQAHDFEWVILDNGSRRQSTRDALARLAKDARVRLLRVEQNLGIIGGMRLVLEQASHRYVLPVDSDDYLFPDALRTIASLVVRHDYPPLLYTDEDKLRDRKHTDPFVKPDWDPVLLRNCCYIAHLCAIDRERALSLGVYSDREAEGCHDWDTFLRFVRAGHAAVHVPEILYSWRMHAASTAADVASKDYIVRSHRHVLEQHVQLTGMADRVDVVPSPFFPASPDWWFRRKRVAPAPLALVVWTDGGAFGESSQSHLGGYPVTRVIAAGADVRLGDALQLAAQDATIVALVDGRVSIVGDEWLWELVGLIESFPDAAMVGGRLLDAHGRVASAAAAFDYGDDVDSPDRGRSENDAGYFGTALKQRSTDVVSGALCGFPADFIAHADVGSCATPDDVSMTVAIEAVRQKRRVIFSPFMQGRVTDGAPKWPSRHQNSSVRIDKPQYHRKLAHELANLIRPRT